MRIATACALALLMVSAAAAQSAPDAKSSVREFTQNSKSPYTISHPQLKNKVIVVSGDSPMFDGAINVSPTGNDGTCWFIRSYNFEREDGQAPVLKDVTTCTPSKKNELRQAKKRSAEFVPLGTADVRR